MVSDLYLTRCLTQHDRRLIRLQPTSNPSDGLICDLLVCCTDNIPRYEALSYVWGDAKLTSPIVISGVSFNATKNLRDALLLLRLADTPRVLWVDAICINQDDVEEKELQVRHMGRIYSEAERVVVPILTDVKPWLLDTMQRLGDDQTLHWCTSHDHCALEDTLDYFQVYVWLHEEWWTRIWTVQEATFAKELLFVQQMGTISGQTILQMANNFFRHMDDCCKNFNTFGVDFRNELRGQMTEVKRILSNSQGIQALPLLELITQFRKRDATLMNDLIFGLLPLSADRWPKDFVSYSQDFTYTFERTTREIIRQTGELDVLSHIFGPEESGRVQQDQSRIAAAMSQKSAPACKLPSWVPDWNAGIKHWTLRRLNARLQTLDRFTASGNTKWTCEDGDSGSLLVQGFVVDTVNIVGEICWSEWAVGTSVYRAWKQTLDKYHSVLGDSNGDWDRLYWDMLTGGIPDADADGKANVTDLAEATTLNRRLIITRQGYIGLGPWNCAQGDHLCIFFGGKVPYVVRENDTHLSSGTLPSQTFLGDVYCSGLMHGQAMIDRVFILTIFRLISKHPSVDMAQYRADRVRVADEARGDNLTGEYQI